MKKIITFFTAVAFSTAMFAQPVTIIHGGGNLSKFTGKDGVGDFTPGYQIGLSNDGGGKISLEPGIFLIHKGGQIGSGTFKTITNLNYLQIPVNVNFKAKVENIRLTAGFGVYGSVGLWANRRTGSINQPINFFAKDNNILDGDIKFYDFGGQIFFRAVMEQFGVTLGYQPGFANISKIGSYNNSSFYLTLSYFLIDQR